MSAFRTRLIIAVLAFVSLALLGTLGYVVLEGQRLDDAVYMTVITLTAVGYEEVWPLSHSGRVFTMVLLIGGITWMGLWFANLTSFFVELDLQGALRRRRTMKEIAAMKDHIIVCGCGRTGRQVAQELETMTNQYVLVEKDPVRIAELAEFLPHAHVIEGDATHDHVLLEAGLLQAKGLVTCLSKDTDNLFVCLSARDLAAKVKIVARAYEEETMDKLYRAGADHVVSPNVSSAIRMASVLLRPSAVSFLDIATRSSDLALRMEQLLIAEQSDVAGKTLMEAKIPQRTGLIVIAVRKHGQLRDFVFNPVADTRLEAGDEVIVLGKEDQITRLREVAG
ncbi:MAG TPA: potassium channel protein [Longimicrobiales bacterium]|nr:potassium channel protein [Longimicrobiales bacterium]